VEPRIYTFSSARKRMSSLWPWAADGPQAMRLFMKGAPEIMLERCSHVYDAQSGEVPMTEELKRHLLDTVMNAYASDSLRTLCIAYRRFPQGVPDLDDVDGVETALVVLAVVGIEDPVRGEVPKAVQTCRDAGITVRMVTGDNIVTARSIARKCGLCLPGEAPGTEFLAMEGPVFRQQVLKTNKETGEEEIDQAKIDTIWPRLLVLARSSPKDKHTLVTAIMDSTALEMRQVVAVTGDGTNDAPALKKAHVGFAMGITGTSVAKDAADIIVMDDNFSSIVQAVKWGRCVYDNICKFLQFQLTVNLAAIVIAVLGAVVLQESPLKAIHLLWINLIMDSLASLALATEAPTDGLLQRKPYSRDKALLSPVMMRNMVCNSVYQFIVILWCIWGLPDALDLECGTQECLKDSREGKSEVDHCESDATTHFTMLFNIFVLMQLFNELNCRKINNERNVFIGSLANPWFVSIMAATSILQILAVEFGGEFFGTVGLHIREWAICMVFGVFELVLYPLITLVPPSLFEPLSNFFGGAGIPPEEDEDEGAEGADPVVGQEMAERRSEAAAAQAPYLKPSGGMFASAMPPPPPQGGGVGETVANIDDGNVTPTPPDPPGSVWGAPQVQQPTSAFQPPQQFQPQVFQPQAAYPYTNQL